MAAKLKRVPIPAEERRRLFQRHLDNISRVPPGTSAKGYAWILRHVDGGYVDRLISKGRYFGYASLQKMAIRFPSRREAMDALTKRDANMRILGDSLFDTPARPLRPAHCQVRVVRLKLKEKA